MGPLYLTAENPALAAEPDHPLCPVCRYGPHRVRCRPRKINFGHLAARMLPRRGGGGAAYRGLDLGHYLNRSGDLLASLASPKVRDDPRSV